MSDFEDGGRHRRWARHSAGAKMMFIAAAIVLVPALLALFTAVTMWLWNWLMPVIFNLPVITFWQAAGILVLSRILFRGGGWGHRVGRRHWRRARIRDRMAEQGSDTA